MNKLSDNAYLLIRWTFATAFGPFVGFVFLFGFLDFSNVSWTTTVPISLAIIGTLMGVGQWAILRTLLKNIWPWIPLTTVGFFLSIPLGLFIAGGFLRGDIKMPITVGIVLGLAQWRVLSRQVKSSIWWIPASILSWGIGLPITLAVEEYFTSDYLIWEKNMLVYGAGLGLLLGILVGVISGMFLIFLMRRPRAIKKFG